MQRGVAPSLGLEALKGKAFCVLCLAKLWPATLRPATCRGLLARFSLPAGSCLRWNIPAATRTVPQNCTSLGFGLQPALSLRRGQDRVPFGRSIPRAKLDAGWDAPSHRLGKGFSKSRAWLSRHVEAENGIPEVAQADFEGRSEEETIFRRKFWCESVRRRNGLPQRVCR